jgi:UDP-N-acetylmuramate dehydrogenase
MLGSICGDVRFKESLSVHTSLRLGGPADIFITPENIDDIRHALSFAEREQMPVSVIGAGTHTLVTERGFRGVILRLEGALRRVEFHGEEAVAGAGAEVFSLVRGAAAVSLGGLASLVGTAGTVGGALVAHGCGPGRLLSTLVSAVYFVRPDGEIDEFKPGLQGLGERALDAPGRILIGCRLRLERQPSAVINRAIAHGLRARPLLQTLALPGAVVWKDPPGRAAGALIEQAGLAGKRVNGAEVCARHPGVIVNRGTATAVDVLSLMQLTRERVLARTGVRLEPSIRTLGELL